ncbi:MAG TPA: hypothetical protein VE197_09565, partial [Mycobacterium sp.]|nr:hypothetical protein [Mycobacterium sp.]
GVNGSGATAQCPLDALGQLVVVCDVSGDVMRSAGLLVLGGDNGPHQLSGLAAAAAAQRMHTRGRLSNRRNLGVVVSPHGDPEPGAPNVLVIVWDDIGYGAMEPFGGPGRM